MRLGRIATSALITVAVIASGITSGSAASVGRSPVPRVECTPGPDGAVRAVDAPLEQGATDWRVHAAGGRVFVLGRAYSRRNDHLAGVVLDCARGRWTEMPHAPFPSYVGSDGAVWTGRELLVIGVPCRPDPQDIESAVCRPPYRLAATWSPTTNRWRRLALRGSPFATERYGYRGYAYGDVIGLGMSRGRAVYAYDRPRGRHFALVDPRTGRTSELTPPRGSTLQCVVDGRITASTEDGSGRTSVWTGQRWTTAVAPPRPTPVRVACTGGTLAAFPRRLSAPGSDEPVAAFDPTGRVWRSLPPAPIGGASGNPAVVRGSTAVALATEEPPRVWASDGTGPWREHALPAGWYCTDTLHTPQPLGDGFLVAIAPVAETPRIGFLGP
jgi:hypothetical protein